MTLHQLRSELDFESAGQKMYDLISRLYPLCRSITGEGLRQTLSIVQESVPIEIHEVPTGTQVLDWTIPKEWSIHDAYVVSRDGRRVIDFHDHSLRVMSYSVPVRRTMTLTELMPHLYTIPEQPGLVPYRTSYYSEAWGFCLSQDELDQLPDGEYDVVMDTSLDDGNMSYGQLLLPGAEKSEVILSTHCCHPSLCNDNLSGIALCTILAQLLSGIQTRYSYRFLFVPGTIGSIAWLAQHEHVVNQIRHGLVVACVGDDGAFTYKQSRRGGAEIDRAAQIALRDSGVPFSIRPFSPYGYDERQYCSPGYNLPVGCLSRTPHGEFGQYHTSADDLGFVHAESLAEALQMYLAVISVLESNGTFRNLCPKGEPQLGRRGLYSPVGGRKASPDEELALLWVLNLSDGENSLLDIAERSQVRFDLLCAAADKLVDHDLLTAVF